MANSLDQVAVDSAGCGFKLVLQLISVPHDEELGFLRLEDGFLMPPKEDGSHQTKRVTDTDIANNLVYFIDSRQLEHLLQVTEVNKSL